MFVQRVGPVKMKDSLQQEGRKDTVKWNMNTTSYPFIYLLCITYVVRGEHIGIIHKNSVEHTQMYGVPLLFRRVISVILNIIYRSLLRMVIIPNQTSTLLFRGYSE